MLQEILRLPRWIVTLPTGWNCWSGFTMPCALAFRSRPLAAIMAEAAFWADTASPTERKAYCLATFNRMPLNEQMAFLDYVQGRSAA